MPSDASRKDMIDVPITLGVRGMSSGGSLRVPEQVRYRQVLEVMWTANPNLGGIAGSVPTFSAATTCDGRYESRVLAFVDPAKQSQMRELHSSAVIISAGMLGGFCGHKVKKQLQMAVAESSLIHIHGLWREHGAAAVAAAKRLRRPYVYSVHGMLNDQALREKKWKKRVYTALVEKRNLGGASVLRAFTPFEVDAYRKFGIRGPVAVVPNGVYLPENIDSQQFFDKFPALAGKQLVLYMGRLHTHKGPDLLIRAWSRMAARFADTQLVLAGPDEQNTRVNLERLAEELGIARRVTFTGNLSGTLKWSALVAGDVFVLPSRSEAFSVGVLEALACSRPVVLTTRCNFPEVEIHRAGLIIECNEDDMERALIDILRLPSKDRVEMGKRGKELVRAKYTWNSVARCMADVYDWLLGGSIPSNVEIQER